MALYGGPSHSFFVNVFNPRKDFGNYLAPYEMDEQMQIESDPVGYYFFHKDVVYGILHALKMLNNRRMDLRDVLREMDRVWRYNSMQRQVLNEPDHRRHGAIAQRVNELIRLTRQKLELETRIENLVTGDVIKNWEFHIPEDNPAATSEKMSGVIKLRTPHMDHCVTKSPFSHVNKFDRRIRIK